MAHIFFERLERRRSTQTLFHGDWLQELPGGWSGNKYSYPTSRDSMMNVSAGNTYYSQVSSPFSNGWRQPLNVQSFSPWDSSSRQYFPSSNMGYMNLYNGQANRFSISSLMSNLFTPQQQTWNLGISNIGHTGPYQRIIFPEEIYVVPRRDYWDDYLPRVVYGFPIDDFHGIGYPGSGSPVTGGGAAQLHPGNIGDHIGPSPYYAMPMPPFGGYDY